MTIYDELRSLQQIPEAYTEWAEYRKQLTDYMIAQTRPGTSLAVCGAGRCNDLDLKRLAEHFSRITLMDSDMDNMKAALVQYGLEETGQAEIYLKKTDFLGISEEEYRAYSDDVQRELLVNGIRTDIEQLCGFAMDRLTPLYEKVNEQILDLGTAEFDCVAVVGIHSQINNMAAWLWDAFSQALGQFCGDFYTLVMQENEIAVRKFNEALIKASRAALVIGCEVETLGQPGSVQGAIQALKDVEERIAAGSLVRRDETELLWPLDKKHGICHRMRIQTLEKRL